MTKFTGPMRVRVDKSALTRRQLDVVELMAEGMSNRQIAEELGISPNTVKAHGVSIRNKLGHPHTRAATVAEAVRRGVLI